MYAKDPYDVKYQLLIDKRGCTGLKHIHDPKAFIEYSNDMQDVYKNIDEYDIDKERKILIAFDDIIADMIRGRKLNIPIVFIMQSYFKVPKYVMQNSTHFYLWTKYTAEPYSFLVNDATLPSDNPLRFSKNTFKI